MQAIQAERPGLDGLAVRAVAEPGPDPRRVLIDVEAAGVGHLDLVCLRGDHQLRPAFPFTPGFEVAGTVRHAPTDAAFRAGDRVAAFVDFGGFAQVASADARVVLPIPAGLDTTLAAAVPVNSLTSAFALITRAGVEPGEAVIIHGGGGGLGLASIEVTRLLGAEAFAVVSSEQRARLATEAGASGVVVASDDWVRDMRSLLAEHGHGRAQVVIDPVGGRRLEESIRCLAPFGRLVSLGFVAGVPKVSANRLLVRNLSLIGADWMPDCPATEEVLVPWVARALASGRLRPPVTRTAPLEQAGDVLRELELRRLAGKAVLRVTPIEA